MRTFLFFFALVILIALGWFMKNNGFSLKLGTHKYTATKFSPSEIMDLVEHDKDYIEGKCQEKYSSRNADDFLNENLHENEFNKDKRVIKWSFNVKFPEYHYQYGRQISPYTENLTEEVALWKNYPNSLVYVIKKRERYNEFLNELSAQNPTYLPKDENINNFIDDSSFRINNYTFIKCGFLSAMKGFCLIVIRSDKIIRNKDLDYFVITNTIKTLSYFESSPGNMHQITAEEINVDRMNVNAGKQILLRDNNDNLYILKAKNDLYILIPRNTKLIVDENNKIWLIEINPYATKIFSSKSSSSQPISEILYH